MFDDKYGEGAYVKYLLLSCGKQGETIEPVVILNGMWSPINITEWTPTTVSGNPNIKAHVKAMHDHDHDVRADLLQLEEDNQMEEI